MRVTITRVSYDNYWYKNLIGLELDVAYNPSRHEGASGTYTILGTDYNRFMLHNDWHQYLGSLIVLEDDVSEVDIDNEEMVHNLRKMEDF